MRYDATMEHGMQWLQGMKIITPPMCRDIIVKLGMIPQDDMCHGNIVYSYLYPYTRFIPRWHYFDDNLSRNRGHCRIKVRGA